jgi:hypothetical protein
VGIGFIISNPVGATRGRPISICPRSPGYHSPDRHHPAIIVRARHAVPQPVPQQFQIYFRQHKCYIDPTNTYQFKPRGSNKWKKIIWK